MNVHIKFVDSTDRSQFIKSSKFKIVGTVCELGFEMLIYAYIEMGALEQEIDVVPQTSAIT